MNKNPVNGMRDILPKEMALRTRILGIIRETYASFGFTEMETPIVESIENLTGKNGGENEKLTFQILKRGEKLRIEEAKNALDLADFGLRYDLTMPLARYYACHSDELPKPFKALQIGPVFRAERPQKGRFREFYQCDIDILGDGSNLAEIELITATSRAMQRIGFRSVVIRLNDRELLKDAAVLSGVPEEMSEAFFIALDKLDKIGEEGVKAELAKIGVKDEAVAKFLSVVKATEEAEEDEALSVYLDALYKEERPAAAENLAEIMETLKKTGSQEFTLKFDPTLVRGMGYYTGPIFEIQVPEFGSSVGGGGRYDRMIGKFVGQNTPACGFSIGFERIITILSEKAETEADKGRRVAFLLEKRLDADKKAEAFRLADALRRENVTVLVAPMAKNKKFQKEQLAENGYAEIREIYQNPIE